MSLVKVLILAAGLLAGGKSAYAGFTNPLPQMPTPGSPGAAIPGLAPVMVPVGGGASPSLLPPLPPGSWVNPPGVLGNPGYAQPQSLPSPQYPIAVNLPPQVQVQANPTGQTFTNIPQGQSLFTVQNAGVTTVSLIPTNQIPQGNVGSDALAKIGIIAIRNSQITLSQSQINAIQASGPPGYYSNLYPGVWNVF